MPTRQEKAEPHRRWLVIWERTEAKRLQRAVAEYCVPPCPVTLVATGGATVTLQWASAVKWDNVCNFIIRNFKVPKERFALQVDMEQSSASKLPGHEKNAAGNAHVAASAAPAAFEVPVAVAAALPTRLLPMKLMQQLNTERKPEVWPCARDYKIDQQRRLGKGSFGEVWAGWKKRHGGRGRYQTVRSA